MINQIASRRQPVQTLARRYYMDLTAQDVRAIVEQHTRLTDDDTAELLAASATPQGLSLMPASYCPAACALWSAITRFVLPSKLQQQHSRVPCWLPWCAGKCVMVLAVSCTECHGF